MATAYECRGRQLITNVMPGDVVYVRCEYVSGNVAADSNGLLPHLVYKPRYRRLDVERSSFSYVRGDDDADPEYRLDLGVFFAPFAGDLYIDGGQPSPSFKMLVKFTISHRRCDPGFMRTLQFRNRNQPIARPYGSTSLWSADDIDVSLSVGNYAETVRISRSQDFPLGFATQIRTTDTTTLYFRIEI